MLDNLRGNVCKIIINEGDEQGTGFLINNEFIMTAYHVIKDFQEIEIIFNDNKHINDIILYKKDERLDIAILKLKKGVNFYQHIGFLDTPLIHGEEWMSFGYPAIKIETGEWLKNENSREHIIKPLPKLQPKGYDLELNLDRKLSSYQGLSGAPLVVQNKIAGIINSELMDESTKELYALSIQNFKNLLIELKLIRDKSKRPEVRIEAKNILELAVSPRDFKKLSNDKGMKNSKEGVHYEYYSYEKRKKEFGFLFLGNNIINKNIFSSFKKHQSIPEELEIFLVKKKENDRIIDKKRDIEEHVRKNNWIRKVDGNIHYIDDFVWENTIDENTNNDSSKRNDFIDQFIYRDDGSNTNTLSLDFFKREIANQDIPISIVYGDGGIGKTTFCDALEDMINNDKNVRKKVFYIKGEKVVKLLTGNKGIQSLDNLYEIYKDELNFDITQEEFNLNYITGNVVVIIDAIEEIDSKLGEEFNLKLFFESLLTLNQRFYSTKIIITTREHVYKKIKEINLENNDIQYLQLFGFTEENLETFLREKYKKNTKRKVEVENFIKENNLFNNDNIIPLFVNLVCEIIDRPSLSEKENNSKYFLDTSLDTLLKFLMIREKDKQSLNMELDDVFELLEYIVLEHNNSIFKEDLKEYIDAYEDEVAKYIDNPLFIDNGENIKIKYDILYDFIKSRSLRYKILNNKKYEKVFSNLLKECYLGQNELFIQSKEILKNQVSLENYQIILNSFIKELSNNRIKKYDMENIKKSISSVLYLAFETLIDKKDNQEYTELLIKLFDSKNIIQHLHIYGDFYPLNFSNLIIINSVFNQYNNFKKSIFPDIKNNQKIIFKNIEFNRTNIGNSRKKIINTFFDKDCRYIESDIAEIAKETTTELKRKIDETKKDIQILCDFLTSTKSINIIKLNCENKMNYRKRIEKFLSWLAKIGLLEEVKGKSKESQYKISGRYRDSIPNIKLGIFPPEIEKEIEEFSF